MLTLLSCLHLTLSKTYAYSTPSALTIFWKKTIKVSFFNHHFVGTLTLSRWRPLSYRNQSIDLRSKFKSMDWFLYDNGLRLERVKQKLLLWLQVPLNVCLNIFWALFNIFNPSRHNPGRIENINLDFYYHTSSWCLQKFYEGLKVLHKTFWGTTKKWRK